jgi:hypothetical protein
MIPTPPTFEQATASKLVSPNGFDGRGPVPDKVREAAKRIAKLRTKFVHQWTPGMASPLMTTEVDQLFTDAATQAEWIRELYEAVQALLADSARKDAVVEAARDQMYLHDHNENQGECWHRLLPWPCSGGRLLAALTALDAAHREEPT